MLQRRWTDREVRVLRKLHADGRPFQEVADFLGRTYGSVKSKAHDIGLRSAPNWTGAQLKRLAHLYWQGLPLGEIGRRMGKSEGAVQQALWRMRQSGRIAGYRA